MTPAQQRRFLLEAATATPYATRPSGPPGAGRAPPPAPQGALNEGRYRDLGEGHAAGWTNRQQAAARRLEDLWKRGRTGWTGPGGYSSASSLGTGWRASGEVVTLEEAGEAVAEMKAAAEAVQRECSAAHARALRMAVIEHQPSSLDVAHLVREALTFLAEFWKLA